MRYIDITYIIFMTLIFYLCVPKSSWSSPVQLYAASPTHYPETDRSKRNLDYHTHKTTVHCEALNQNWKVFDHQRSMILSKHIARASIFTQRHLQLARVRPQPSWSSPVELYPACPRYYPNTDRSKRNLDYHTHITVHCEALNQN